jgi:CBS domain-containing protein
MIAKQIITDAITPLKLTDTGSDALMFMDEMKVSHLPVVEGNEFVGLVSETDIYNMKDPDAPIGEQKLPHLNVFVNEYQHFFNVIGVMAANNLTLIPVVDDKVHYTGSIMINNLVKYFSLTGAISSMGSIIVLELNQNDYVLSQISQIVESHDQKILSLYVTSQKDSTKIEVTMKVNSMDIQPLIQTFNRYNYIIKATYSESTEMYEDLRDRYDALMNYLNI